MDDDHKALFMVFVTGTSGIPLDGFDPSFNVTLNADMKGTSLPKAHTCFNQIVIPPYVSRDMFEKKLMYAIKNTTGFMLS